VELPFTIVFEPPSRRELRALLRMRGHWVAGIIVALTIGTVYLLSNVGRADAGAAFLAVPLALSSQPAGAAVVLDGHDRGVTPAQLMVEPGTHSVMLKARDALDGQYTLDVAGGGAAFEAMLWRHQPGVTHLKPTLPGASLADVRLLEDGTLGLSVSLPPDRQLQAWRLDPLSGGLALLLSNITGPRLVFSADGRHLAYVEPESGPPARMSTTSGLTETPVNVVAWSGSEDRAFPSGAWRAPLEPAEQLVDVSWSPTAQTLLTVSKRPLAGGAVRSRFWLVDAQAELARPILSLPSELVPGSEVWSPDGGGIAFVARAGQVNALCLLMIDGTFRYLADLDPSSSTPLEYSPLVWSADGQQLLFVAPHQHPPGASAGWLQPDPHHAVYVAKVDQPTPVALGDTDLDLVRWREDGLLLGLGRTASDSPLSIRLLSRTADSPRLLLELPLRPPGEYAAVWDERRARLLVASPMASGGIDYWLVRLGLEGDG